MTRSGRPSRWDTPAAYASALRLDAEPSYPAITGCSSLSAEEDGSPDATGSGTSAPQPAAISGGGVREGPGCAGSGWPAPDWPGDGPDSAWSIIRVLAEDRFLNSHTVMIAPDERPYSYFEKHYRSARGHLVSTRGCLHGTMFR